MKSEFIERRYKMNANTTVTIKSKKVKDSDVYENIVTLTNVTTDIKPLQLGTREELEAAIKEIDMSDPQLGLFGGAQE